jgi:hypothetical protein
MLPLSEFLVQTPEDLDDTQRGGRNRVGEISSWRRNTIEALEERIANQERKY